ncbi:hypothetical protein VKT23_019412 [Stygiomarasmius scandens]|uniref:Uncharacterized protein n=1 Tax=Marasmiellus scandens TaxID=2682957 RepID=A0ABR1ILF8_9AGAR
MKTGTFIFYGSQTGEEYAIRLAKETKSKFDLTSLVCDPEEYDFERSPKTMLLSS